MKHATLPAEMHAERRQRPDNTVFRAWADFSIGRAVFIGTGPEVRAWTIRMRNRGASKVGYAVA